jgi:hypothetical protein
MGKLETAEQTAREALSLMESCNPFGWAFVAEICLGGILLYRGKTEEALRVLTKAAAKAAPVYFGFTEGLMAWALTATGMDGAADARTCALQFLPRPGTTRGVGTWNAVLNLTEALCLSGDRHAAGDLRAEAENIADEWDCNHTGFPVRTAAGIAAACAGDWIRSEEHHRAAIGGVDGVPYITAQPIARYWYANMLAERRDTEDIETAKTMLKESIDASDRIGLALYARLARQKLVGIS